MDSQIDKFSQKSLEQAVLRIFADALELNYLEANDNFFDLGGNSLMATRVIIRLRQSFQVPLMIGQFFENPTASAMAVVIGEAMLLEIESLSEEEALKLLKEKNER